MTGSDGGIVAFFAGTVGSFALEVSFEAPARGVTALFGPSGCGKTTTLRCMAGLQRLRGRLRIGGQTWQDSAAGVFRPVHARPIGYVFQEASLFAHLSVRENLSYGARRAAGEPTPGLDFDDVVELLGIGRLLERPPTRLSGGERSRVAIGRALLARPQLLLMDEPLTGLDRESKDDILPYFDALHRELTMPIIYVSHDIAEVAQLADHMVVMSGGRVVFTGSTAAALERLDLAPLNEPFEASVVLTARVVEQQHRFHLTLVAHDGQLLAIPAISVAVGTDVRLRIRTRDVSVATRRPEGISIRNVLTGRIAEIVEEPETAFAETLIDLGGAKLRARLTREAVADLGLTRGMAVYALIKSITFDGRPVPLSIPAAGR